MRAENAPVENALFAGLKSIKIIFIKKNHANDPLGSAMIPMKKNIKFEKWPRSEIHFHDVRNIFP